MVDVGGYCIDATEVTEAQYAAFLAADAGFSGAPGQACNWKTDFLPANPNGGSQVCRWDPATFPNLPVVCVDWCDAFAFCKWAGKRLCGAISGGAVSFAGSDHQDATKDQWYRACSKGGVQKYPYGNTFDGGGVCNVKDGGGVNEVADAGAFAGCAGGYAGLHDMVGNAFEHEDSCSGTTNRADFCMIRGGSWFHPDTTFSSCPPFGDQNRRDDRFDDVGFRCCSP
jgi:sulfatase modifying factor 1